MRFNDLTGRVFDLLTVVSCAGLNSSKQPRVLWLCRCACGSMKTTTGMLLTQGQCKQCDKCYRVRQGDRGRTHGLSKTPEYQCWANAIQRCTNKNSNDYRYWGGRGVKFCDRWRNSYDLFIADMGPLPEGCNSLDRYPDRDGNYEPGNCRWSEPFQQCQNMRSNVNFTHDGKTMCMSAWARELGIKRATIDGRMRRGKTFEEAIGVKSSKN